MFVALLCALAALGQTGTGNGGVQDQYNQMLPDGTVTTAQDRLRKDSLHSGGEIPRGLRVWTVDARFGDIRQAQADTLSHMFMNSIFTNGLRGEYNSTGYIGAPRVNRVFIDRDESERFFFAQPYDFIATSPQDFHFTNTLSPYTNLFYHTAGNRTNGDDHLVAKYCVNAGKRVGVGFNFDYIYGRGFYSNQGTSHFKYTMYGSYLGERYQAHLLFYTLRQKVTENGGITDDEYIRHPESYDDNFSANEIPVTLERNWNRIESQHIFFTHRYSLGFRRKVKMSEEEIRARKFAIESRREREQGARNRENGAGRGDAEETSYAGRPDDAAVVTGSEAQAVIAQYKESMGAGSSQSEVTGDTAWIKEEYVPVVSFIHTAKFDNGRRIYQAYDTPRGFYARTFPYTDVHMGDSIFDETRSWRLHNTFAVSLLEGFNRWAKAGLKAFVSSEMRHYTLPDSIVAGRGMSYNEHSLSVGAQLLRRQGSLLNYDVTAETWLVGKDAGQLRIDGKAVFSLPLLGDTVRVVASGFFHRVNPAFYYRHYHAKHFWWDNDSSDKTLHSRLQGALSFAKTRTRLRVAYDNILNHTYLAVRYGVGEDGLRAGYDVSVRQRGSAVNLLTVGLEQDFCVGPLHWDNVVTYQKSSDNDVIPVPALNVYSNLYLRFRIARVLKCDFGVDVRYFTEYEAPEYTPALGQYAVNEGEHRYKTGNYPIANVYANFHLKNTRFFVMMSHVSDGMGNRNSFLAPHYPVAPQILRFGLSWNFFN